VRFFPDGRPAAGGCAYYKIQPVPASSLKDWGKTGGPQEGYIFYQPELYFFGDGSGGFRPKAGSSAPANKTSRWFPLYLPNYQRPFRVTTRNFLAKSDFTFNFENGWKLTQISDRADNTAVANTLAGQLQTSGAAAGAGPFKLPATNHRPRAQLRVILFRHL